MKNNNIKKYLLLVFLAIIIFFFTKSLYQNFSHIVNYKFSFNYFYILLSLLSGLIFIVYIGILRISLIKERKIPFSKALNIHLSSRLAKYIPGNAGIIVSKIYFLSEYGIDKKRAVVISIYENVFQITSAFIISLPLIFFYFFWVINQQYIYLWIIFIIASLVFLHPGIFFKCINIGLKLFKRQQLEKKYFLWYKEIIKYFFLYSIGVVINGFAFYFIVKGITDIAFINFLPLLWAWNFAGVIWVITIFAPWGLGVREGVLVVFLKLLFPLEIAVLISVFSRFRTTALDWIIWLYILAYKYIFKKPID